MGKTSGRKEMPTHQGRIDTDRRRFHRMQREHRAASYVIYLKKFLRNFNFLVVIYRELLIIPERWSTMPYQFDPQRRCGTI
jgi:hypothetical protein